MSSKGPRSLVFWYPNDLNRDSTYGTFDFTGSYDGPEWSVGEIARQCGAAFSFVDGQMLPLQLEKMLNPQTGRFQVRKVNVDGDAYECACH